MNDAQKTYASNIIFQLKEDAHLQWGAIDGNEGFVFVGRTRDGAFRAYAAKEIEEVRYDSTGKRVTPEPKET